MKLKNIVGTAQRSCSCSSWLRHWERHSGQKTEYCQVLGCVSRDVVGAHVQLADGWNTTWYIYPLCKACNQSRGDLEVSDNYALVEASTRRNCGS